MSEEAFAAGVRPGGLTDETQIRVLLCYMVQHYSPVCPEEMQEVLWGNQLVNYFSLQNSVSELCKLGYLVQKEDGLYTTASGKMAANDLSGVVPRSVRERAMDAMLKLRTRQKKAEQVRTTVDKCGVDYLLRCKIEDLGRTLMDCTLSFPDLELAEHAKERFCENADLIYQLLIAGLTADSGLAKDCLGDMD